MKLVGSYQTAEYLFTWLPSDGCARFTLLGFHWLFGGHSQEGFVVTPYPKNSFYRLRFCRCSHRRGPGPFGLFSCPSSSCFSWPRSLGLFRHRRGYGVFKHARAYHKSSPYHPLDSTCGKPIIFLPISPLRIKSVRRTLELRKGSLWPCHR